MSDPILAADTWATNAHLIESVAALGYLQPSDRIIDPTYGKGVWWKRWQPSPEMGGVLVGTDLAIGKGLPLWADQAIDFRSLPFNDGAFDAATFDPPYIAQGGRSSSTLPDFLDRFGLVDVPHTCAGTQELINAGLVEAARVVKPKGIVLVKCKDYVNGGRLWLGTHHTLSFGLHLGMDLEDRFEHVGRPGPQPRRDRQLHARRNLSTLFVFRTPK